MVGYNVKSIHIAEYPALVIAYFTASVGRFQLIKENPLSTDFYELAAYPTALFGAFFELFGEIPADDVPIGRRGRFNTAYAVGVWQGTVNLRQFYPADWMILKQSPLVYPASIRSGSAFGRSNFTKRSCRCLSSAVKPNT